MYCVKWAVCERCPHFVHENVIDSLGKGVLLGFVWCCGAVLDASVHELVLDVFGSVFLSVVGGEEWRLLPVVG